MREYDDVCRERDALKRELHTLQETLIARHGGEPLALLAELDAAREDAARYSRMYQECREELDRTREERNAALARSGSESAQKIAKNLRTLMQRCETAARDPGVRQGDPHATKRRDDAVEALRVFVDFRLEEIAAALEEAGK